MGPLARSEWVWRDLGILQFEPAGYTALASAQRVSRDQSLNWDNGLPDGDSVVTPPVVIEAPEFVRAGKSFVVTVYTIGPDGCWSADGHEVRVSAGEIEILPYDRHSGAELCTRVIQYLPHRVVLTLDEPGAWVLRVRGRRASQADVVRQTTVAAEATIRVVP